jgi:hypothetical protein
MRVLYEHFRASLKTWKELFQDAADFATEVGPERLISISHSAEGIEGIVTVWYWGEPNSCHHCGYDLTGNVSGTCPECGTKQTWTPPQRHEDKP